MVEITVEVSPPLLAPLSAWLIAAGVPGVVELPGALRLYAGSDEERGHILARIEAFRTRLTPGTGKIGQPHVRADDVDYHAVWLDALEPVALTKRLWLHPWRASEPPPREPGKRVLWFEPTLSFGSGEHATTRLLAQWLEDVGTLCRGAEMLDVGCGSGVLGLVALESGFSTVLGVDIDEVAVRATQRNAELNDQAGALYARAGSAGDVAAEFPVVVANILSSVLLEIREALVARVAPGGRLTLTGLLTQDADEVRAAFVALGLDCEETRHLDDWSLLALRRT